MHTLPAGLFDQNAEFFADADMKAFCLTGGRAVSIDELSGNMIATIEADMLQHPEKLKGIAKMGIYGRMPVINQYVVCNYGGFDHTPDMINGQLQQKEYWPCPKRGICKMEGIVCDSLKTNIGEVLTSSEVKVLKHVAMGYLDKEIAHKLNIAIGTVTTHTRNIRKKTGFQRKADLTRFATQKHLI
ncbi:regulatory protein, luxR family [Mucilaginibacter gossypiicola]|uniref:Regulatory protein, luxR family n=1 Tax=Mucilaginibacter gossypiicola TaxID=551995 RepID=A0A1H8A4U4_9SPHI|nr:helix-turn-helix transcriptional regulator [Mucilaginibacter gossypiicola]SEM65611.1 regulatory protein, luxR family [Mucilaginibacter gossypiicola]